MPQRVHAPSARERSECAAADSGTIREHYNIAIVPVQVRGSTSDDASARRVIYETTAGGGSHRLQGPAAERGPLRAPPPGQWASPSAARPPPIASTRGACT